MDAGERKSPSFDRVLVLALALGLVLRCWGLKYGLPHVYNPDEISIMSRALGLAERGLNPGNFLYPSFYFYVLALAVGVQFAVFRAFGVVDSLRAFERAFWTDPTSVYLMGRGLSAIAGTLAIAATYCLAYRAGGRRVAGISAALMAVAYIPVRDAHFVKHDVPVTLLVVCAVLACWSVRERGRMRDSLTSGALAGMAFATHYYAVFTLAPLVLSHILRTAAEAPRNPWTTTLPRTFTDRRLWAALGTCAAVFVLLSPYVILDWTTALRDITANRAIIVDRAQATFGPWGAGLEHVRLMATQGTGIVWLLFAAVGFVAVLRRSVPTSLGLLAFPISFFLFIANAWPFGRTGNPLYPFLAVLGAIGIERLAGSTRRPGTAALTLTVVAMAQPLWSASVWDFLTTRTDTRTLARDWIQANVGAGETIAVEPYSVPLTPSREWLREVIARHLGSVDRAGHRLKAQIELEPYPVSSYRLYYLGKDGMDQDKLYLDPDGQPGTEPRWFVLKLFTRDDTSPLRERIRKSGRLAYRVSPFRSEDGRHAQLPDYDIKPSLDVTRPGPIIEIWKLP